MNEPPAAPHITLDPTRPIPPYEQIRQQVADLITAGVLTAHTRLPPVRQLAADLDLAVGTVARAYQELETAGLVHTRRGGGTRVRPQPTPTAANRQRLLTQRTAAYVAEVRRLGITDQQALSAVATALAEPSPNPTAESPSNR
jgi:GntR family transcriptional regulator